MSNQKADDGTVIIEEKVPKLTGEMVNLPII